jgi:hypothetical protein
VEALQLALEHAAIGLERLLGARAQLASAVELSACTSADVLFRRRYSAADGGRVRPKQRRSA